MNFTLDICLNFLFALGELILDPIKTLYRNTSSSLAYMDCRHWPYLFFSFSFPSLLFSKSNPLGFWNYVNRSTQDEKVRGFLPHKLWGFRSWFYLSKMRSECSLFYTLISFEDRVCCLRPSSSFHHWESLLFGNFHFFLSGFKFFAFLLINLLMSALFSFLNIVKKLVNIFLLEVSLRIFILRLFAP